MNLQTGVKEAKLLDNNEEDDDTSTPGAMEDTKQPSINKAVVPVEKNDSEDEAAVNLKAELMRENIIEALKQIKSEDGLKPEVSHVIHGVLKHLNDCRDLLSKYNRACNDASFFFF